MNINNSFVSSHMLQDHIIWYQLLYNRLENSDFDLVYQQKHMLWILEYFVRTVSYNCRRDIRNYDRALRLAAIFFYYLLHSKLKILWYSDNLLRSGNQVSQELPPKEK